MTLMNRITNDSCGENSITLFPGNAPIKKGEIKSKWQTRKIIKILIFLLKKWLYNSIKKITHLVQTYLEFGGGLKGISRNPATQSTGFITIQGTTTTTVPLGTQFQTSDSITLETLNTVTILTDTISITNIVQSGGTAVATTTIYLILIRSWKILKKYLNIYQLLFHKEIDKYGNSNN